MEQHLAPILAIVPPPVQFVLTFLVGLAVNRLLPWQPSWTEMEGVRWIGWALAGAGVALSFFAAGRFVFRRTTLNPAGRPAQLVVDSAHAWSRNPMYVALTAIYAGVALGLGEAWPLALVILPCQHELDRDLLRGGAPSSDLRPGVRGLLPKGAALDLT